MHHLLRHFALSAVLLASSCRAAPVGEGLGGDGSGPRGHRHARHHEAGAASPAPGTPPLPPSAGPDRHLPFGAPKPLAPSDDILLEKREYVVGYAPKRLGPSWVGWRLVGGDFGPVPRHKGKFLEDAALPSGVLRATHDDYTGSGFDRGHMCRSEDRTSSPEANLATFLMTNILPQTHELNAGPWLRLEEYEQALAQREGRELYVVAGGLHAGPPSTIGRGVAVPTAFFKVVVALAPGEAPSSVSERTRVIAVVMPNVKDIEREPWGRYRTSVDEVERRAGYDLLPALPEPAQRALEARVDDGPTAR